MLGTNILEVEVTNISKHGFWLFYKREEYFLPFEDFSFFKNQSVEKILSVKEVSREHFYWDQLDVDLSLKIIKQPEKYPLVCKEEAGLSGAHDKQTSPYLLLIVC